MGQLFPLPSSEEDLNKGGEDELAPTALASLGICQQATKDTRPRGGWLAQRFTRAGLRHHLVPPFLAFGVELGDGSVCGCVCAC